LCCKSAFWILDCSFNKYNNWATRQYWVNFWNPNLSVFFLLFPILFKLYWKIIENASDLSWFFIHLQNGFVCLGEQNSGGDLNIEFFESFWTSFSLYGKVFNIVVTAENVDGVIKIVKELNRLLIVLWVESVDQKRSEIVHEVPEELFVWFKDVWLYLVVLHSW
jgi:hypothetical protein